MGRTRGVSAGSVRGGLPHEVRPQVHSAGTRARSWTRPRLRLGPPARCRGVRGSRRPSATAAALPLSPPHRWGLHMGPGQTPAKWAGGGGCISKPPAVSKRRAPPALPPRPAGPGSAHGYRGRPRPLSQGGAAVPSGAGWEKDAGDERMDSGLAPPRGSGGTAGGNRGEQPWPPRTERGPTTRDARPAVGPAVTSSPTVGRRVEAEGLRGAPSFGQGRPHAAAASTGEPGSPRGLQGWEPRPAAMRIQLGPRGGTR